ncbi:uncharacterized protein A1O9_00278 [Exophiala aquamarina CBS 119918]|uniref:Uncharacterized protein n=1 Tax=Exophiala aquamarina CBS 119918 TaxID=1182545 RepID=A0A072PR32_9EURO|nr:uncharacterized protein A1O9_00278 [Exophiala aquamarina CBS 119918]KEF62306.1 hypothetical protein A1O9_00278 [Exophiala aquamarina CBS 119918]
MLRITIWLALCCILSTCQAQTLCDVELLYSRLLADAVLADSFCAQFLATRPLSSDFDHQFGSNCDVYKAELTLGCSVFKAAKRVLQQATLTITVTESLIETMTVSASREECTPITVTVPLGANRSLPSSYLTAVEAVREDSSSQLYNINAGVIQRPRFESSFMTFTTRTTSSTMSTVGVVDVPSSTLSTTVLPTIFPTVSSLAPTSPTATGECVPIAQPPAVDYHVFQPLIDLSFDNSSSSIGATTVIQPDDTNLENCTPYTVIYLPDESVNTCVRMTGEWTPQYSNAYYKCIARVRAPDFNPENYLQATTGLNFTANDGSYSMVTSRTIGRRPEKKYKESSMMLFAQEKKAYNVGFWACGPGMTLFVSELSCTHYG